jgi:Zn-finger nucleic acid-binding protein
MQTDSVEMLEIELKYCERCGGLWLRPLGMREVYCRTCVPLMADLPLSSRKRVATVTKLDRSLEGECEELFAICCEGGHA